VVLAINSRMGDCSADELNAIVSDHLRGKLPRAPVRSLYGATAMRTPVIFRVWQERGRIAKSSHSSHVAAYGHYVTSYQHIGQHCAADYGCASSIAGPRNRRNMPTCWKS